MIRFAENLNKMIAAGLGGAMEAPSTEVAVGYRVRYMEASGAVVSFESNGIGPVKNLRVTMEPIQEGTGDPSPDNIRPITGRDIVRIWRDATYDPSADPALTIQLGQTVYSGTLDVLAGKMTVDKAMVTFDGTQPNSNFGFETYPDYATPRNRIAWSPIYTIGALGGTYLSDTLIADTTYLSTPQIWHISNSAATVARMFIGVPTTIASIADWQAYVTEHPISVIYDLADPLTIQLTPAQLSTLAGENTIWSDAGDVSLEYPYYEETEGY